MGAVIAAVVAAGCSTAAPGAASGGASPSGAQGAAPDLSAALGPVLPVPVRRGGLGEGRVSVLTADGGWSDAVWAAVDRDGDGMSDDLWHGVPGREGTSYDLPGVTGLAVGTDGWTWAVAAYRLVAFDGSRWRPLADGGAAVTVDGTPAVARDGAVWVIGADSATVRYDGTVQTFPAAAVEGCLAGPLAAMSTAGAVLSGGGDPGWGTSPAACLLRLQDGRWVRTAPDTGATRAPAFALAADPLGRVWAWFHQWDEGPDGTPYLVGMMLASTGDGVDWVRYPDAAPPVGTAWSMAAYGGTVWAVFGGYEVLDRTWVTPVAPGSTTPRQLYRFDPATAGWSAVPVHDDRGAGVAVDRLVTATHAGAWLVTAEGRLRLVPPPPWEAQASGTP